MCKYSLLTINGDENGGLGACPQRIFEPTPSKTSEDTPLRNRMYLNFISDVHANTRRRSRTFNMFSSDFEDMDQKKKQLR